MANYNHQIAINYFNNLPKGTEVTKDMYQEFKYQYYRNYRKVNGLKHLPVEAMVVTAWDILLQTPEKFGVEKIAKYYTTTTSKIKAIDVLEMVKQGMSVEEIEAKLYTQVRYVVLKTK